VIGLAAGATVAGVEPSGRFTDLSAIGLDAWAG
jgi:hypothetical protein